MRYVAAPFCEICRRIFLFKVRWQCSVQKHFVLTLEIRSISRFDIFKKFSKEGSRCWELFWNILCIAWLNLTWDVRLIKNIFNVVIWYKNWVSFFVIKIFADWTLLNCGFLIRPFNPTLIICFLNLVFSL